MQHKRFIIMEDTGKVFNRQTEQFEYTEAHDDRVLFSDREMADEMCAKLKKDTGHGCLVCTVMIWDRIEE